MLAAALATCLLAGGCAIVANVAPLERLDTVTAVHMTIMGEPWVYARDARDVGANVRDYVNIGMLETDRAGQRSDWLGAVLWSTVDRSTGPGGLRQPAPGRLRLVWADRTLDLEPYAGGREAVGATRPVFAGPRGADLRDVWYLLSPAVLKRLAGGPPDSIQFLGQDGEAVAYGLWRAERRALRAFLEATGAATAAD